MPRPHAVQKTDCRSSCELYTACAAAPVAICTKQIADEDGAGNVACVWPSSDSWVSESSDDAASCTAHASGTQGGQCMQSDAWGGPASTKEAGSKMGRWPPRD